jgi:hypothetical protein
MYLSGSGFRQKYSSLADTRFGTDRRRVKEIFVDETLLQRDDGHYYYWLWIAYEPNLNISLTMHLSKERFSSYATSSSSSNYVLGKAVENPFLQMVFCGTMMLVDG